MAYWTCLDRISEAAHSRNPFTGPRSNKNDFRLIDWNLRSIRNRNRTCTIPRGNNGLDRALGSTLLKPRYKNHIKPIAIPTLSIQVKMHSLFNMHMIHQLPSAHHGIQYLNCNAERPPNYSSYMRQLFMRMN